jgi:membrane protease YdiL (CAAX protease family)
VIRRVAVVVGFCLIALLATLVAQAVWTGLLVANLKVSPRLPWAVVLMALILWSTWRYVGGAWWPASTRQARLHYRRANAVALPVLGWAMAAGLLGLGGLIALWLVLVQLVRVPGNPAANFANYSPLTVVSVVAMASLVGAVTEEVGLRGYMLTRLEAAVGGWPAVVIVAVVISPGHGVTQGFVWPTLAWYFLADLLFGALSLLTRSILPGIAVHAVGLLAFFSLVWPTDRYRHVVTLDQQPAVFWVELALCVLLVGSSLVMLRHLAGMSKTPPAHT